MFRVVRRVGRAALLSILVVPCFAWADALPGNPDDIYFHCTPAEQCPTGSEMCPATIGPAGQRPVEPACAARATEAKLEHRCWGKQGHLYCPVGATGSWKKSDTPPANGAKSDTPPPATPAGSSPRRGCS